MVLVPVVVRPIILEGIVDTVVSLLSRVPIDSGSDLRGPSILYVGHWESRCKFKLFRRSPLVVLNQLHTHIHKSYEPCFFGPFSDVTHEETV